ncbi:hypothetical protein H0H92_011460 [Tricholoma furcatifolium]|nr:hypothetical protein H0H92_011460 [Tricholoma furcatifolium]
MIFSTILIATLSTVAFVAIGVVAQGASAPTFTSQGNVSLVYNIAGAARMYSQSPAGAIVETAFTGTWDRALNTGTSIIVGANLVIPNSPISVTSYSTPASDDFVEVDRFSLRGSALLTLEMPIYRSTSSSWGPETFSENGTGTRLLGGQAPQTAAQIASISTTDS